MAWLRRTAKHTLSGNRFTNPRRCASGEDDAEAKKRGLILHGDPGFPPEADAASLPDTPTRGIGTVNVDMKRQFMAGLEQVNTTYSAAVHDAQTLLVDRPVCLWRRPVCHGQVIYENTVALTVLIRNRITIVQAGIEQVIVLVTEKPQFIAVQQAKAFTVFCFSSTAPVIPRCSQTLFRPDSGCT